MLILITIICLSSYCLVQKYNKLDKRFYDVKEVYPQLVNIYEINNKIEFEVKKAMGLQNNWVDWPEKYLYNSENSSWKIYPFFAFGIWVDKNCQQCPTIANFLKSVKGLRLGILSKLSPNIKLEVHQGYASHSNNVLRCHYPIIVPKKKKSCEICVSDSYESKYEKKYYQKFKWIVFDDSRPHYAENSGESDRIVLMLDIDRPDSVAKGKSTEGDSKELLEIIKYFRENQ
jgi:aspartyl/asparaginyl beta-hydroxylase (cupin superfamily)